MNCQQIQNKLSLFFDQQLSPDHSLQIEVHLKNCSDCQNQYQSLQKTWSLIDEIPPLKPSPDFEARFWARAQRENKSKTPWLVAWWKQNGYPAAVGALAIFVAAVLGVIGGRTVAVPQAEPRNASLPTIERFTEPFPVNSLEQLFLSGPSNNEVNPS